MLELYVKAWLAKQKASNWFRGLFRDEEGATIAEYAILLAVVVVALIAILGELTDALWGKLNQIINEIRQAPTH
ncbi:MAG: Flp family type IVb pilin [Firmicutes bacterium]|nr:Flp family type IVb pilin [Candidatus Fermentithermobacillaceae bacterium]